MDTKIYPKKSMVEVATSTNVICSNCRKWTDMYEVIYKLADSEVYFHKGCVSDDDIQNKTETKIVELQLTDDINVKSEGA